MAINKRLLVKPPSTGITPSEHFGVVLYEGDGSTSHSINGGKFGAGAYFDGSSSKFNTGVVLDSTTFSASVWFRTSVSGKSIIGNINTSGPTVNDRDGFNLLTDNYSIYNNDAFVVNNASYNAGSLADGNWHHIVITNDGSNSKIYIDGSLDRTDNSSGWNSLYSQDIYLGFIQRSPVVNFFDGKIDQVRIFQKVLSSSEVSTLYAETVETVESLDPLSEDTTDTLQVLGDSSCVATYRFENDEVDLSGNYDGTGTAIQYAAGRYGQAGDFNGSTSEVTTSNMTGLDSTTISLSAWVYFDAVGVENTMLARFGGCGNHSCYQIILRTTSSNVWSFATYDGTGNGDSLLSTDTVSTGKWYNVVIVADGTSKKIYVNKEQIASSTVSFSVNTSSGEGLNIGGRGDFAASSTSRMNGRIDQVRTFNKAISAAEVTTLYNENSLVASYRFEGNANDDMRAYNGSATNVTYEYGLGFTPDFVWIKNRTTTASHIIHDSTRGAGISKNIYPDFTGYEGEYGNYGFVSSFDTGGFTVDASTNAYHANRDGDDYVAWCLKANGGTTSSNTDGTVTSTVQANTQAGFSIIKYVGNGVINQSIGHGLNSIPELYITKNLDTGGTGWFTKTTVVDGSLDELALNTTDAASNVTNTNLPTSSVIYQYNNTNLGANGQNYIVYAFHSVEGFSSFGSYVGNGSTNGPIVETGFEPAFLLIKPTNIIGHWRILDNKRNQTNPRNSTLKPDESEAETTHANEQVDFLSNGFQLKTAHSGRNGNGDNYLYMAFAADPDTEAPTVAKSFSTVTYTGTGSSNSITGLGFEPNLVWIKNRSTGSTDHYLATKLYGPDGYYNRVNQTAALTTTEVGSYGLASYDNDGFTVLTGSYTNNSGNNYVAWAWKADDNEPTIYGGSALAVYKFEDNANDVRGNYNATATNITYVTGKFNKAASFVLSNSSEIDFSNSLHGSSFSMSFWMKATDMGTGTTATGYSIYSAYVDVNNYFRPVLYGDGSLLLLSKYSGTFKSNSTSSGIITENTWHHIVFNFTPTDTKAYVDGVNVGTFPSYDPISFTAKAFGTNRGNPDFTGDIDQLRFYDAALTQENVTALYEETASDNDDLTLGAPGEVVISANSNAGFSIVKYEGDGVADMQVPHGLSAAPEMIFIKNLDDADKWAVYNSSIGATKFLVLNETAAAVTSSAYWNNTAPTSTVFTLGATSPVNSPNNENYIAYCFHSVSSYSKIGSYTGNGSATGPTVTLNFAPDWIMIKRTDSTGDWRVWDSVRDSSTPNNNILKPNTSEAEAVNDASAKINFLTTGFQPASTHSSVNTSGATYIYMAFKIN